MPQSCAAGIAPAQDFARSSGLLSSGPVNLIELQTWRPAMHRHTFASRVNVAGRCIAHEKLRWIDHGHAADSQRGHVQQEGVQLCVCVCVFVCVCGFHTLAVKIIKFQIVSCCTLQARYCLQTMCVFWSTVILHTAHAVLVCSLCFNMTS